MTEIGCGDNNARVGNGVELAMVGASTAMNDAGPCAVAVGTAAFSPET